jgi:YD repeat-containing protein
VEIQASGVTPTRETATTYQVFANTPIFPTGPSILDRPCSVVTRDSSGNPATETDYLYDAGTSGVCGEPGSASVASAGNPVQHDSAYASSAPTQPPRGNLTTATRLCLQGCTNAAVTTYTYDETGQILSVTDPCGNTVCSDMVNGTNHTTQYSYADSYTSGTPPGNTDAYLTKITRPATNGTPHVESFSYSYADGQLTQSVDENNQPTTYKYNTPPSGCSYPDGLDRLSEIDYPNTGRTTYCYNDAPYSPTITTTKTMNSSQSVTSVSTMDGVGHVVQTQLSDPQGAINSLTTFDGSGSAFQVYNPYRSTSDPTYGYTTYVYDALGRTRQVVQPDNSTVSTTYSENCTTVTDEASKSRESCTDGLGRLTQAFEDPSVLNWETDYSYDALDDLTSVVQGGSRNRSFSYDSLGRLTQSINPESGTINYSYDTNGNLSSKIAPAPNQVGSQTVTTSYTYDALNRVTGRTYSNGDPSVTYAYDQSACLDEPSCYNIGQLTTITDAAGTEYFAYDVMGQDIADQRTTNGNTERSTYLYDLAGDLTQLTYPSGRIVNYTFDSAGRPSTAQDAQTGTYYVAGPCPNGSGNGSGDGACYAPQGSISEMQNGSNLLTSYIYNSRLQPCWIYATTNSALPTGTTCSSSDPGSGNILDLQYCFYTWVSGACEASTTNNGDVTAIANNRDNTRTQSFSYDSVNRLASAQTASTSGANCWGETYTYDEWANLKIIGSVSGYTGCTQESLSVSPNSNNQLSGLSYDAGGNVLYDGTNTYLWNAANEMTSAAGVNYTYDGDGKRVEKSNGKIYWYGPGGEVLDESDGGNITDEYIFFGGKRIAHIAY